MLEALCVLLRFSKDYVVCVPEHRSCSVEMEKCSSYVLGGKEHGGLLGRRGGALPAATRGRGGVRPLSVALDDQHVLLAESAGSPSSR